MGLRLFRCMIVLESVCKYIAVLLNVYECLDLTCKYDFIIIRRFGVVSYYTY